MKHSKSTHEPALVPDQEGRRERGEEGGDDQCSNNNNNKSQKPARKTTFMPE